jgi:UDP:flavonoid glycosyltransferase YjiC (YdhE family)
LASDRRPSKSAGLSSHAPSKSPRRWIAGPFVHHGGVGTSAAALRAGVPSLVTPIGFDQFDNAARIAGLGVGASVPFAKATTGALRRGLSAILDREHAATARALAAELADEADGAERAAEAILAHAQRRPAGTTS